MKLADEIGMAGTAGSILIAIAVLTNTNNGRMAQGGALFEFIGFAMFVYAGVRGSRWWFSGPVAVIVFWIVAAHIGALWN